MIAPVLAWAWASAAGAPEPAPPVPGATIEEGRRLYGVYCASCHGASGGGDGPASTVLQPRPARFADPAFWETRDDDRLRRVILDGGASVGRSPLMAGFAGRLDPAAVDALVAYLRASWAPPPVTPASPPAAQ